MLSYLYRLATAFERTHGHRPNLALSQSVALPDVAAETSPAWQTNEEEIAHLLKMDIIISPDTRHPDVAWVSPVQRRARAAGRG